MSQFILRARSETEHHKLNQTELEPKAKQNESKLESIGMIPKSNRNSSRKNESKANLSASFEATKANNGF